jgi:hypothetical protein
MKARILIPLVVLAIYFFLFITMRATSHDTVQNVIVDRQGAHPGVETLRSTIFVAPLSGFARFSSRALFVSFYPLGRLDHLMTGRPYLFVDLRAAAISKCEHWIDEQKRLDAFLHNFVVTNEQPNTPLESTPTAP